MYVSKNYICFQSKVDLGYIFFFFYFSAKFAHNFLISLFVSKMQKTPKELELIVPIRNIYIVEKPNQQQKDEHNLRSSLVITSKEKVKLYVHIYI